VKEVARERFLPMDVIVRTPEEVRERLRIGDHFVRDVLEQGKVMHDSGAL
jgi:hypothetical protein